MEIPIFSQIEKLINERGSAKILQERLELAKDQYAALEKRAAEAEERASRLQAASERLRGENAELQARLQVLQERINSDQQRRLDAVRERALLLVAQNEGISDHDVAARLGIGKPMTTYHLGELRKSHLVSMQPIAGSDFTGEASYNQWYIQQEGLAYLAEHGLLE